jgi:fatty-acyl-CoA synthase
MRGLMMDYPLTLTAIVRRAEQIFPDVEIASRKPDKSIHRTTYAAVVKRARHLAAGLDALGLRRHDRVATLAWNHAQHLEAYYAIPCAGMVCHTLNLRLHPDDLAYIATHAGDRAIIVDDVLLPLLEKFRAGTPIEHVIVIRHTGAPLPHGAIDFEDVVATGAKRSWDFPELAESDAAAMCYTSGTTGRPKGVVYSHRSQCLHSLGAALNATLRVGDDDTVLAIVPMFHANAWGIPYLGAMTGARQVFPGPHLDSASLLDLLTVTKTTLVAGVPTIMLGLLAALDALETKPDLSSLRTMLIGGAAVPQSLIRSYRERYGITIQQGWGMTETSPLASVGNPPSWMTFASPHDEDAYRARQGRPAPFVELRARNDAGELVPWDGVAMGELEIRGPWITSGYYDSPDSGERFTADGWFRTGDIASLHPDGSIEVRDRTKDVIKSGGEWISSVALENAIMGHPSVAEAAVIGVAEPRWTERPLAVVVLKPGKSATHAEIVEHLLQTFPKWWMPDATEFVEAIPRTSAGKFLKTALRQTFADRLTQQPS